MTASSTTCRDRMTAKVAMELIAWERHRNHQWGQSAQWLTANLVLGLLMWTLSATRFNTSENDPKYQQEQLTLDLLVIEQQVAAMNYRSDPLTMSNSPAK